MASRKRNSRPIFTIISGKEKSRTKNGSFLIQQHMATEIVAIVMGGFIIFTVLSVFGGTGFVGQAWYGFLRTIVGTWGLYSMLFLGILAEILMIFRSKMQFDATRILGIVLLEISFLGLVGLSGQTGRFEESLVLVTDLAGYVGFFISFVGQYFIADIGTRIVLFSFFLIALVLIFQKSFTESLLPLIQRDQKTKRNVRSYKKTEDEDDEEETDEEQEEVEERKPTKIEIRTAEKETIEVPIMALSNDEQEWRLPSLDLLDSSSSEVVIDKEVLEQNAEKIKEKLHQFNIEVSMRHLNVGPTVMQYTLAPDEGVKLSKITALKDDLALALATHSIRIEAPIPGKSLVGIEIPNDQRMAVHLREMLQSKEFQAVSSNLRLPLGKDVSGVPIIEALETMPHLLIAGSTGSGKSVAINSILLSLLYQNTPRDLRLILVDPKRVELSGYNHLNHLLTPVITEPDKAVNALRWTVAEMMRRYKACQIIGARNRDEYNKKIEDQRDFMPNIIFVIDELADLMMTSMKKEVETLICRIAQMARAVGIHLIVATQRPSVDVITGLIKANIPARVAFTVVSAIDSRTILDCQGAEDLIGKGDMLFISAKMSKPMRIQGVFVSSEEIEAVVTDIRMTIEPQFDESVVEGKTTGLSAIISNLMPGTGGVGDMSDDALVEQAIQVIQESGKVSASLFQRRLKLGYARAARIVDILEERGLIGPSQGAKQREIFIEKK